MVGRRWADECPRLSRFVAKVHKLFEGSARQQFLKEQIVATIQATYSAIRRDADWYEQRRDHFERVILEDSSLLNARRPRPGLLWHDYERYLPPAEAAKLPRPLRDRLDVAKDSDGKLRPIVYATGNLLKVSAWGPPALAQCHDPRPKLPLPPQDIGRDYRPNEVCFALAALHDTHGSYGRFVQDDNPINQDPVWWLPLRTECKHASDSWVEPLESLLRTVIQLLPAESAGLHFPSPSRDPSGFGEEGHVIQSTRRHAASALNELILVCSTPASLPGQPRGLPTAQESARAAAPYLEFLGLAPDARRLVETADKLSIASTNWLLASASRNSPEEEYQQRVETYGYFDRITADDPNAHLLLKGMENQATYLADALRKHCERLLEIMEQSDNPAVTALSNLKYEILQAMLELNATSDESRRTTEEIAARAQGLSADVNKFKGPLVELKNAGYVESKQGRGGGYWLTVKGKKLAEKVATDS